MRIKTITALLVICAALSLGAVAFALENGQYAVSNNTYYVNPDTGVSEDGGDTSIGEGMARNAVKDVTLYEKSAAGQFVTLRLGQSSYIKDIRIQVDGRAAAHEVTGKNESENTIDLRFPVNSDNPLIQPSFFVGPMNRDVTFYVKINAASAKSDAASLAKFGIEVKEEQETPIETPAAVEPVQKETEAAPITPKPSTTPTAEETATPVAAKPEETPAAERNDTAAAEPEETAAEEQDGQSIQPEETEEPLGIVEFPAEKTEEPSNPASAVWAIAAVAFVCLILAGGYFLRGRIMK
jgi:hypothetical protein